MGQLMQRELGGCYWNMVAVAAFAAQVVDLLVIQLPPYHSHRALVGAPPVPSVSVEEVPCAARRCCCSTTFALAHSCAVKTSALRSAVVLFVELRVSLPSEEPEYWSSQPELELAL